MLSRGLQMGALVLGLVVVWITMAVPGEVAALAEDSIQFQDGTGNVPAGYVPGVTAVFYIKDADLGPSTTSVATWAPVPSEVSAGATWSLATGAPHASAYTLASGSTYDTSTPASTPLTTVPTAKVNGVTTLLSDYNAQTGEFNLLNDVNASSTLAVTFTFDAVDAHAAGELRAKVTSTSDSIGEWVSVSEVASETDSTPSSTSGLFRGQVTLSGDSSTAGTGDGAVWVQGGDDLAASYYAAGGIEVIDAHVLPGAVATPTSTPVPTSTSTPNPTSTKTPTPTPTLTATPTQTVNLTPTSSPISVVTSIPTIEASQSPETGTPTVPVVSVPGVQIAALIAMASVFLLIIHVRLRRATAAIHRRR